ncbi:DMT family transporter [Brevibacillus laterosporus]|uniref:Ligand-binding protein SH3 n=1 Tax=Brevibacillus laterosporus TaxID=1465 RepID=A0AAP3DGD4_BRELA|nr:SMR family transporter [Brevibacillus laterosporus]ATO50026.1 ligand-binding protein SH3 [Brevibacillus laterosporus DSM 25]AYB39775.1 QacE family quaternary ammonium compound efflux SMR transporter [Brevibacillus laterosporus]MBG9799358.1 ligand-binding protein SH3 [Brevibacillus laterosporus]MBG9803034.1 ligand-binding protein SH3 [Brevibacillus laterosporus]MBM7109761.1 Multidrug resistance protein YkkC [Brevibacillus laterosporus]
MNKAWIYVILTCLFELFWVYAFNVATTWWHWAIVGVIIIADFYLLSKACETLPTGTVYAIFAAAGTVGTALMDIFIFEGLFSLAKGLFMGLLVIGVISLKLADNKGEDAQGKGVA